MALPEVARALLPANSNHEQHLSKPAETDLDENREFESVAKAGLSVPPAVAGRSARATLTFILLRARPSAA